MVFTLDQEHNTSFFWNLIFNVRTVLTGCLYSHKSGRRLQTEKHVLTASSHNGRQFIDITVLKMW